MFFPSKTFEFCPVISQLPTQDQLKTVLDKVKDFFGDAKESFGKISSLNPGVDEESPDEKAKQNHILNDYISQGPKAGELTLDSQQLADDGYIKPMCRATRCK
ncbi:hypothetical protein DY000_02062997, partial [Brassica cretica]